MKVGIMIAISVQRKRHTGGQSPEEQGCRSREKRCLQADLQLKAEILFHPSKTGADLQLLPLLEMSWVTFLSTTLNYAVLVTLVCQIIEKEKR